LTPPEAASADALTPPEADSADALTPPEAESANALTSPEADSTMLQQYQLRRRTICSCPQKCYNFFTNFVTFITKSIFDNIVFN
jgi:hypothetical protein